jgi:tetratricopeptide (TPR) repeat protein
MSPSLGRQQPASTLEILPFSSRPAADAFDLPAVQTPASEARPNNSTPNANGSRQSQTTHRMPAPIDGGRAALAIPAALEPMPAAPLLSSFGDMLPVIVSDYVDTADGWCAEAERAAEGAKTIDDFSAVIELCQQGLRNEPSMETASRIRRLAAWSHNRRGEILAENQRPQDALAEFDLAIGFDPDSSLAIHNRAVTLAQQNRPADALADFNRVIELNPGLAVAYRNRGELLVSIGLTEDSIRDYNRALEQLTEDADLYCARAFAWQQLGQLDKALDDLNRAIRLSSANAQAYTQRASLAVERGDFAQAVRDLQRSIQLNATVAEPHRSLAWLLATCPDPRFRDSKLAVEQARQAQTHSAGADPMVLDTLAAAQASAGDFAAACDSLRQALQAAPPDFAQALHARLAMYERGQPFVEQVASDVQTASFEELAPNGRDSLDRRGR